uniref:DNA-directed RNA polymerase n=1 Tax=Selaginella doederleinii TaxID=186426 RepID=A0A482CHM0_9TRAC|nr:RNA polymerase beta'' subunit [Selaginella doederleinii]QBL76012.1 RNA polymerase beta'' subunit [Selaginella doederleinii]
MAELGQSLSCNRVMDRTAMKQSMSSLMTHSGTVYTAHIPDQPKTPGFQQATHAAVSLGIDDLITTPSREWLIQDAESRSWFEEQHRYGNVHAVERSRRSIEARYTTSEYTKTEMNPNLRMTDPLNPAHVMPLPGARGNISQTHQSLGMRGSMPDPKGQIIDLPIRSNPREGPSSTEHMISRYGARKGIADIAVRTADAGYLTRRLVEVVQRIVARTVDRGTIRGITVSPVRDRQGRQMIAQSRPIGRVSADNAYVDTRCIATRDQETGAEPADQSIAFQKRPISIRPPSARKSMFWICRSRHGRSLTHGDPIGLGEAVGIMAGQSIGEPGTQLTLRTSHTGGISTGDIARHTRTPSTGTIMSNANSVHPTRTRHGHPAWICDEDLSVATSNEYEARHPTIPSPSSIPVRNNQHVESKQVIAEVRATTPIPRERVHKYIHSNLYGEMHLGTRVMRRHNLEQHRIYSNIHIPPETSYVRVSSGGASCDGGTRSVFHGGGDKIDAQSLPPAAGKDQSPPNSYPWGPSNPNPCCYHSGGAADEPPTFNHQRCDRGVPDDHLRYLSLPHSERVITRGHERGDGGGVLCPSGRHQRRWHRRKCGGGKRIIPREPAVPERQQKKVSRVADSPANHSGYTTTEPEMIESRTMKVGSAGEKTSMGNDRTERLVARHQLVGQGNFRSISEDLWRIIHESPRPIARANVVRAGTRITPSDIYCRSTGGEGGLTGAQSTREGSVVIEKLPNFSRMTESDGISETKEDETSMPTTETPDGASESMDWHNHRRRVALYTDKAFASLRRKTMRRPAATEDHEIRSESGVLKLLNWDLLGKGGRAAADVGVAAQYPPGEYGVGVNYMGIRSSAQKPRLLPDRRQTQGFIEEAYNPSIEVITSTPLVQYHESINRDSAVGQTSVDSYGYDTGLSGFQYLSSDAKVDRRASGSPNDNNIVFSQHEGIPRISQPDRYRERTSFLISSPDNACKIPLSTTVQHMAGDNGRRPADGSSDDVAIISTANLLCDDSRSLIRPPLQRRDDKRSTRLDFIMTMNAFPTSPLLVDDSARGTPSDTLGIPGNNLHGMGRRPASYPHLLTRHRCLTREVISEDSTISNLFKKTSRVLNKWFLRDEDRAYSQLLITHKRTQTPAAYFYPSSPTQCFLPSDPPCTTLRSVSPGRLICRGVSVRGYGLPSQSCEAKAFDIEFAVMRLAEPSLAKRGATVHDSSGSIVGGGDAPITSIHERSRFEDTIFQGPPKIEQFSESRPNTSVSTDLKDSSKDRSSGGMAWIFGRASGYLLSARISLERSRINPVARIGRGYRSQGVQVADKHTEIIARQVTSKMVALEDGMANASPPGELTEVSRARRMDCALEAKITCRPVLSGVTRASPNTKSLIPGASSRETTRVSARAAIRGQTDRSKGLKENAIVGGMVPAGTSCEGTLRQVIPSSDELEEISGGTDKPFHPPEDLSSKGAEFRILLSQRTSRSQHQYATTEFVPINDSSRSCASRL